MNAMALIYEILVRFSLSLIKIIAPFSPKTKKWVDGQKNSQSVEWLVKTPTTDKNKNGQKTIDDTSNDPRPKTHNPKIVWFHAASLGEFEQGRPVIEAFRQQYPDSKIVLTFFSPSGYDVRKNYHGADLVCYLPADTRANVRRFLDSVQPDVVLFIKYEFWFNYLTELKRRQIPTILFSAIFRPNQPFFKWYGAFHRQMLHCFDSILVQNKESFNLLKSVGYQNVILSGDTRFDRVLQISKSILPLSDIEAFKGPDPMLIIGSAWPDDMAVLIPFINNFKQPLKVIVAPHEIDKTQIEQWQGQLSINSCQLSVFGQYTTNTPNPSLLFIDSIGLLSALYQYADFAYIGGAFGDGLHNVLEPAAFGVPLFFGDKFYDKFQEAHDLIALEAAFAVSGTQSFETKFTKIYQNKKLSDQIATKTTDYVATHAGATQMVIDELNRHL